jgi:hypothetical protein
VVVKDESELVLPQVQVTPSQGFVQGVWMASKIKKTNIMNKIKVPANPILEAMKPPISYETELEDAAKRR